MATEFVPAPSELLVLRPWPIVRISGQEVLSKASTKLAFVVYLVLGPAPHPRERLARMFWPHLKRAEQLRSLNTLLHSLRDAYGENAVIGEERLEWGLPVITDVARLNTLAGGGAGLAELLDVYRGHLLGDWTKVSNATDFWGWAAALRVKIESQALGLLEAAVAVETDASTLYGAEPKLRRLLPSSGLADECRRRATELRRQPLEAIQTANAEPEDSLERTFAATPPIALGLRPIRQILRTVLLTTLGMAVIGFALLLHKSANDAPRTSRAPICRDGEGQATLAGEVYYYGSGKVAGEEFTKVWLLTNIGDCAFASDFLLSRVYPEDSAAPRLTLGPAVRPLGVRVDKGQTHRIELPMRAPEVEQFVEERWVLLDASSEPVQIGENATQLVAGFPVHGRGAETCSPGSARAAVVAKSHVDDQTVPAGESFIVNWTLRNAGDCAWGPTVRLGRVARGQRRLDVAVDTLYVGRTVQPGFRHTFSVTMRAPLEPGRYTEEWEPYGAFGEPILMIAGPGMPITVRVRPDERVSEVLPPPCPIRSGRARFLAETVADYTTLAPDDVEIKSWTLQNVGDCRWESNTRLRFYRDWGQRLSRVAEIPVTQTVLPGGAFTFAVRISAPVSPGPHHESWQLVSGDEVLPIPNGDTVWVRIVVSPQSL